MQLSFRKKWLENLNKKFFKNIIWHLIAGESHQVVKITVTEAMVCFSLNGPTEVCSGNSHYSHKYFSRASKRNEANWKRLASFWTVQAKSRTHLFTLFLLVCIIFASLCSETKNSSFRLHFASDLWFRLNFASDFLFRFIRNENNKKRRPYILACISAFPGRILVPFSIVKILLIYSKSFTVLIKYFLQSF